MNRPVNRDKLVMALCDLLVTKSTDERTAFLETLGAQDPKLRQQVKELLESIENSGEFLVLDSHESDET